MKNFSKTILAAAAMTFALGANAAVIEYTSNTATNIEENDGDLALAKFDASLGNLTSVKIELFNTLSGSIGVTNDGPSTGTFFVSATGKLEGDVVGNALAVTGTVSKDFTLASGAYGSVTLSPWTVSNSLTLSSGAALAAFTGAGTFYHALLTGTSSAEAWGSGNATYDPVLLMDGYAKVTYTYDVAPVPEPETYAMMLAGLGLVGAIARRRKSA
ncbi:choice-of-anchor E domain-containing protein [Duganella radicis]|uniref:choice-of-anchor E domain-containing protein n=1 Tax=Duganella radicis TaxID=551988 RepID=UPI001E34ECA6|nr:choice-of-anchor E domain-containing protein [Duganella radicis]